MKRLLVLAAFAFLLALSLCAQNVGIGTGVPHPSALLDVSSNSKGALMPRMTSAQRKAIVNPAAGLLVFDLDKNALYLYDGQNWRPMGFISDADLYPTPRFASDGAEGDLFGSSVAVSGEYAIAGAEEDDIGPNSNQGSAYIFVRNGGTWMQQTKITATDGATGDLFGISVAISGDYVIVGAQHDESSKGAAYIFMRSGNSWVQQAKLIASDGLSNDHFGAAVSISGDYAIVGADYDDVAANSNQGSAYVFVRNGGAWTQQAKLVAPDGAANEYFGGSVSISGDYVVVGAPLDNAGQGSAYIFVRGGNTWTHQQKLVDVNGGAAPFFGFSVCISGDVVIVGAYGHDQTPAGNQGAVHIYSRLSNTWLHLPTLSPSDLEISDGFGYSVSISGEYFIVGTIGADISSNESQGYVSVYKRTTNWPLIRKVKELNGTIGNNFGLAVAINGSNIIIGSKSHQVAANMGSVSFLNIE